MIGARFDCYTPGSRRLYEFEDVGEQHLLTAELRRTLDAIAAAAPARIAKGLSEQDVAAEATLWLAMCEDLEALTVGGPLWQRPPGEPTVLYQHRALREKNGIAWTVKVEALRRQIELRRNSQEVDIAKGRLTAAEANARLERLEAVHDLYWRHGYAFDGRKNELRAMSGPILDTYLEQQQAAWERPPTLPSAPLNHPIKE